MDDLTLYVVIKPLRRGVPLRNRRTVILFSESMISILSGKFVTRYRTLVGGLLVGLDKARQPSAGARKICWST